MKKVLIGIVLGVAFILAIGASLTTRMSSYRTFHSDVGGDETDPADDVATGFFPNGIPGVGANYIDLLKMSGAGKDTGANAVQLILRVTGGAATDTVTQKIYGAVDGGPRQLIASVVWTIGTAQVDATATNLWAHDAAVTSTHTKTITEGDGADSDRVCSIMFDCTGFRYLAGYFTADTGAPTSAVCLYRCW